MGQNGSENDTPFGKAQVPSGCSCFKGYFGDIKAKSGYLVGKGPWETCSTTARDKESRVRIYKSYDFSDFNIFLWVVFRRVCIVGIFLFVVFWQFLFLLLKWDIFCNV